MKILDAMHDEQAIWMHLQLDMSLTLPASIIDGLLLDMFCLSALGQAPGSSSWKQSIQSSTGEDQHHASSGERRNCLVSVQDDPSLWKGQLVLPAHAVPSDAHLAPVFQLARPRARN